MLVLAVRVNSQFDCLPGPTVFAAPVLKSNTGMESVICLLVRVSVELAKWMLEVLDITVL